MKVERLRKLRRVVEGCKRCKLAYERTQPVFGEGDPNAKIIFVGEGPGKDEDLAGVPFVGRSGKLLRALIGAIGISPEKDCFIANVCKCRPPNNRTPESDEIATCVKFLWKQIEIISPKIIVLLGRTAVNGILPDCTNIPIDKLRDESKSSKHRIKIPGDGLALVVVTYHPSAVLRDPFKKPKIAEDFKFIEKLMISLYGRDINGYFVCDVSSEQLLITPRVSIHGGKSGNFEGKDDGLPSLFSEE